MEHVGTALSRAQSRPSSELQPSGQNGAESIPKASDGARRAARVWRAMTELYGPQFKAAYGDNPTPIWERAIAELTDDQCRDGLTSLAHEKRDYPANLTVFLAACQPKSAGVRYLGVPLTDEQKAVLSLPKPNVPVEKIDGWLAKMRRTVGVAP
jgi:hypothetical protein